MQSKSISRYIFFGTTLRYLQDVKEGWKPHGKGSILENIDMFLSYLEEFTLPVTQRAAFELLELKNTLKKLDNDHKLTASEATTLREIINNVRRTLFAEADGSIAFIVTDKRLDVDKLISDTPALMAPGVFSSLPAIAKYDFTEACKCIAFERCTAAAFHLLRGTEDVLRHFYCNTVKQCRVDLMWGPMVNHLQKRRVKPPVELLNHLDNIRQSFRNPTQHPDKKYDIQEVQDLFSLCVDVVNRMCELLKKKK